MSKVTYLSIVSADGCELGRLFKPSILLKHKYRVIISSSYTKLSGYICIPVNGVYKRAEKWHVLGLMGRFPEAFA